MNKFRSLRYLSLSLLLALLFSSCLSRKNIVYFQGDAALTNNYENYIPKIQPDDILSINVTAVDMKAAAPFNQQASEGNVAATIRTYTVQQDGSIDFPVLGKLKAAGYTRQQLTDDIKLRLNQYIVNPGVNINFTNFRVTVMGEVARPGTFTLPAERVTVLEALAMAGDLTIQGVRKKVTVLRELDGKKSTYYLDLTQRDVINSPVYYLMQNDLVYVEPNRNKVQSNSMNYSLWISISSLAVTIATFFVTR